MEIIIISKQDWGVVGVTQSDDAAQMLGNGGFTPKMSNAGGGRPAAIIPGWWEHKAKKMDARIYIPRLLSDLIN